MRLSISLAALAAVLALAGPAAAQDGTYHGTLAQCADGQSLQLRAGQRYVISASSDAFDTVLRIARRGAGEVLATNDDGGEGTNSRVTFSPAETGEYVACVSAYTPTSTGAYALTVENAPALPAPTSRPTRTEAATWQVFEGTLAEGDAEDNGSRFDDYRITIPDGQRAIISADSTAFDTVVKVYRADDRGGDAAATDDDSGGNLNSLLVFAPDAGGDYIVRVTSYSGGSSGAYRLHVTQSATPPRPSDAGGEGTGE